MIRMVDLYGQYLSVKDEIDAAMGEVMRDCSFVRGPQTALLEEELAAWTGVGHCVTCGSGTDALLLAMTAIGVGRGDEVIVPAFTFGAVAETVAMRGATPVFADVDPLTFNIDSSSVERLISGRTRAVVAVHMFGQPCDMPPLFELARRHGFVVVEDNAQSLGARCRSESGAMARAGSVGLAQRIRMIANHGQSPKYNYLTVGINSRLDTLQAAVLRVKLRHLHDWIEARRAAAERYDAALKGVAGVECPVRAGGVTHVYHQYTLRVDPSLRDGLRAFLADRGIESMVYYPSLLNDQEAYRDISRCDGDMRGARRLPASVLSLPICSHIGVAAQARVMAAVKEYFGVAEAL